MKLALAATLLATPLLATPILLGALLAPNTVRAEVSLMVSVGPPPLPAYAQPVIPGDGYLWSPGYWAWSATDNDYYWVPGTWVLAPAPGYLWTPGYWAFAGGGYRWHFGYWSDEVGYYGGINYGYGYFGSGYSGGRWERGAFNYNRSVNNINTRLVHHVYNQAVPHNPNRARTSFNGGPGGVATPPSAAEANVPAGRRMEPTEHQSRHEHSALEAPAQRASVNHGAPQLAATRKPSEFVARGMEPQRSAPSQPARSAQPQAQTQAQAQPPRQQERPQVQAPREQREPRVQRESGEQRAPDRQRDGH